MRTQLNRNHEEALKSLNVQDFAKEMLEYGAATESARVSSEGFNATLAAQGATVQSTTLATKAATVGMKALSMAGNIAISAGVMLAVQGAIKGFQYLATYRDKVIKDGEKTQKEYSKKVSSAENNIKKLQKNQSKFDMLSKGTDDSGKNIGLSSDQYKDYVEIRKQVLKMNPSLISGYDAEGNAIANNNTLMEKAIALQKEKVDTAQKDAVNSQNWEKQAKSTEEKREKYQEKAAKSVGEYNNLGKSQKDIDEINTISKKMFGFDFLTNQGTDRGVITTNQKNYQTAMAGLDTMISELESRGKLADSQIDALKTLSNDYSSYSEKADNTVKSFLEDTASIVPKTLDGYQNLSKNAQNFLDTWIKNQDISNINLSDEKARNAFKQQTKEFAESIIKDDSVVDAYEKYNKTFSDTSKKSAKEWENDVKSQYKQMRDALGKAGVDVTNSEQGLKNKKNLQSMLGIDLSSSGDMTILSTGQQISGMIDTLSEKFNNSKEATKYFEGLSLEELNNSFQVAITGAEEFTGSLDQLKERLEFLEDSKVNPEYSLSDYLTAKDSENAGDDYLKMVQGLKDTKSLWDEGLVGTDDFKTFAGLISPSGATDDKNFIENYGKAKRYLTTDHTGVQNMMNDLTSKGYLNYNEKDGWSGKIENTKKAAKDLGVSTSLLEETLNRAKDYDFSIDFTSFTEQYDEANSMLDKWTEKWKENGGKTGDSTGQEIEDYRQKLMKFKKDGDEIPDNWEKVLKLKVEAEDVKAQAKKLEKNATNYAEIGDYQTANTQLKGASANRNEQVKNLKSQAKELGIDVNNLKEYKAYETTRKEQSKSRNEAEQKGDYQSAYESSKKIDESAIALATALEGVIKKAEKEDSEKSKEESKKKEDSKTEESKKKDKESDKSSTNDKQKDIGKLDKTSKENYTIGGQLNFDSSFFKGLSEKVMSSYKSADSQLKDLKSSSANLSTEAKTRIGVDLEDSESKIQKYVQEQKEIPPEILTKLKVDTENAKSEQKIQNLKDELGETQDVEQKVKIHTKIEKEQDNITKRLEEASGINNKNEKGVEFIVKAKPKIQYEKTKSDIKDLEKQISGTKDATAKAKLQVQLEAKKDDLNKQLSDITNNPKKFTVKANTDAAQKEINKIDKSLSKISGKNKSVKMTAKVSGEDKVKNLQKSTSKLKGKSVSVKTKTSGEGKIKSLKKDISAIKGKNVKVKASVSGDKKVATVKSNLEKMPTKKSPKVNVTTKAPGLQTAVNNIGKIHGGDYTINVHTNYTSSGNPPKTGGGGAYGTANIKGHAHVNGTVSGVAHANGSIGTDSTQKNVMISELQPEMVVNPRTGRYIIYNQPTMLDTLPKDSIVFNGQQTEDIIKHGKTTSFGKSYVNGTVSGSAYVSGAKVSPSKFKGGISSSNSSKSKSKSSSTSATKKNTSATKSNTSAKKKNTKQTKKNTKKASALEKYLTKVGKWFDFIDIKLNRLSRATDMIANSITDFVSSTTKAKKLMEQYNAVGKEIKYTEKGASKYKSKASSFAKTAIAKAPKTKSTSKKKNQKKLKSYFEKVRDGSINISEISNDNMRETVSKYQELYEKYLDAKQAAQELKNEQRELFNQWLNMPIEEAQKKIDKLTKSYDLLASRASVASTGGSGISALYNVEQKQISSAKSTVDTKTKERDTAKKNNDTAKTNLAKAKKKDKKAKNAQTKQGSKTKKAINSQKGLSSKKKKSLTKNIKSGKKISTKGLKGNALKQAQTYNKTVTDRDKTKKDVSSAQSKVTSTGKTLSSAKASLQEAQSYYKQLTDNQAVADKYKDAPAYEYQNYLLNKQVSNKKSQNDANQTALKNAQNNYNKYNNAKASAKKKADSAKQKVTSKGSNILSSKSNLKKLSDSQEKAIKAGKTVSTKGIKDKKLLKQLQDYNKLVTASKTASSEYTKATQNASDALNALNTAQENASASAAELAQEQVNAAKQSQSNIKAYYDSIQAYKDGISSRIDADLKLKKQKGQDLSEQDYMKQILDAETKRNNLVLEQQKMQKNLEEQMKKGYIKKGTQEWYEMQAEIDSIGTEIVNLDVSVEEFKDTMRDDVFYRGFERARKSADALRNSVDAIISVIDEDMMFDSDTGQLTDYGVTSLAMNMKTIDSYKNTLKEYLKERSQLDSDYKKGNLSDTEYTEKIQENENNIAESVKNIKSAENSVISIIKNQSKASLDATNKMIDAYATALKKKKEYYDYDKNLKSQNKEIQLLKSQIAALNGVTDSASKAQKARLEAELAEKTETRDDTIKDHVYQLQVDGLDELKTELSENYEKYVEELVKNVGDIEKVLNQVSNTVTASAKDVIGTIDDILKHYGVTTTQLGIQDAIPHAATGGLVKATKRAGDDGLATLAIGEEVATADTVDKARIVVPELNSIIENPVLSALSKGDFKMSIPSYDNMIGNSEFNINFDDAIRIDNIDDLGNISDAEFKRLLEEGYKYTAQKLVQEYARATGHRPQVR